MYAVPMGAPVDVAPVEPRRGRRDITAPQDPTDVSREEFDAMVRDLGIEQERQPASTGARPGRTAGGRRARANRGRTGPAPGGGAPARPATKPDGDDEGSQAEEAAQPRRRRLNRIRICGAGTRGKAPIQRPRLSGVQPVYVPRRALVARGVHTR